MKCKAQLPRILCVDDEPNLLAGLERSLYGQFDVTTADSGAAGLDALETSGPFAVIVSDMRMPGMDGAVFLARARERAPDSVRILLTGHAAAASTAAAIKHGGIFRFLSKPCRTDELSATLHQAVTFREMTLLERELLATTLSRTVGMLNDVLSSVAPALFQRTTDTRAYVRHALTKLDWSDGWAVQLAAALSQIGLVSLPADLLQRHLAREPLDDAERALVERHPEFAHRRLVSIPRLETVAEIVRHQAVPPPADAPETVVRGSHLLRAALQLTRLPPELRTTGSALEALSRLEPSVPGEIARALVAPDVEAQNHPHGPAVHGD